MVSLDEYISQQREICARFGAAFDPPVARTKLGFALESQGESPTHGIRHLPVGDTFKPLHVEHLVERCPPALRFLALPPGWGFTTDENGYVDVWFDPSRLTP